MRAWTDMVISIIAILCTLILGLFAISALSLLLPHNVLMPQLEVNIVLSVLGAGYYLRNTAITIFMTGVIVDLLNVTTFGVSSITSLLAGLIYEYSYHRGQYWNNCRYMIAITVSILVKWEILCIIHNSLLKPTLIPMAIVSTAIVHYPIALLLRGCMRLLQARDRFIEPWLR